MLILDVKYTDHYIYWQLDNTDHPVNKLSSPAIVYKKEEALL